MLELTTRPEVVTRAIPIAEGFAELESNFPGAVVAVAYKPISVGGVAIDPRNIFPDDDRPVVVLRDQSGATMVGHFGDYFLVDDVFGNGIMSREHMLRRYEILERTYEDNSQVLLEDE